MRSLSSPAWLSLLLELSHRGSLPVQRRVSRLLRVLVPLCDPDTFQVRDAAVRMPLCPARVWHADLCRCVDTSLPGHDAWVVSDVPAIGYEFHGAWQI